MKISTLEECLALVWTRGAGSRLGVAVRRAGKGQINQGDRGLPTGRYETVMSALEVSDSRGQLERSWSTVKTVGVPDVLLIPMVRDVCGARKQRRRAPVRWRSQ